VRGALLVAPPDPADVSFPEFICGFDTVPNFRLPYSSIVIASSNDPYGSLEFQAQCARNWGSRFINAGARGHLNGTSGLGTWPEAHALLEDLIYSA
jgi:predicted alpha/beta hydrolase family esterase